MFTDDNFLACAVSFVLRTLPHQQQRFPQPLLCDFEMRPPLHLNDLHASLIVVFCLGCKGYAFPSRVALQPLITALYSFL